MSSGGDPLFHMSLGSKELFHSNLIGWLAERYSEPMRHVFEDWLSPVAGRQVSKVRREHKSLDLVLEFPGFAPLIIENKMFSVPRADQLRLALPGG